MASAPLLILLVAVTPAAERAVAPFGQVSTELDLKELARAPALRVADEPGAQEQHAKRHSAAPSETARPLRTPRVVVAALEKLALAPDAQPLPRPPVFEPGAPRGPPALGG